MNEHVSPGSRNPSSGITVSEGAAARIRRILAEEPGKIALRVMVEGGGCSGFSYRFELADDRRDDEIAFERDGATVLVDAMSLVYMAGSELDFIDDLMGQSFQVRNPNAVASCGCGTSFSI